VHAGQLEYLAEAEEWAATHTLLVDRFAVRWFLGLPLEGQRLQDTVRYLQPHEEEVDQAMGSNAFRQGGGLYAAYFHLKVISPPAPAPEARMTHLAVA